ncbi:hypothetical protein [Curtobacterium sp. SL109]|uniref:hypothetical protein n=1 Tax=Curtobacterium sp. SL109 TaxID=2994662 RepID=UPI002274C8F4|nr:hypothetical protein [Curtobacterium sp. SL109]MCY1696416.1 hypothetical protein [Curtobacterium sp. SL109]
MHRRSPLGQRLLVLGWFLSAFFLSSAPLVLGVIAADIVPAVGGVRRSVPVPVLVLALMAVVGIAVVFGGALERLVERLVTARSVLQRTTQEAASALLLWLLLLPLMERGLGAAVAAGVSIALYKAAELVLDRLNRTGADTADD